MMILFIALNLVEVDITVYQLIFEILINIINVAKILNSKATKGGIFMSNKKTGGKGVNGVVFTPIIIF